MRIPAALRIYGRRLDPYLIVPMAGLILIGMLVVYSATEFPDSARAGFFLRHLLAFPIAIAAMLVFMVLPLRLLEDFAYVLHAIALVLLIGVLVAGIEVYGARRWLGAGPLRMQPSEFAKLTTILVLARFLSTKRHDPARLSNLGAVLGLALLPLLLVLKQPDLGTSGAFVAFAATMLVWAGLPGLHLLLLVSPLAGLILGKHWLAWGAFLVVSLVVLVRSRMPWLVIGAFVLVQLAVFIGGPIAWGHLEPYQKARLTTFLDPGQDPGGAGYQLLQSKIAVGSGGMWGKGFLKGSQKALAFLPQQHTDFIFSVVGEEFGFLGSLAVLVLFLALVFRAFYLALHCRSPFSGLLAVGLGTLILYHSAVNMAMTVGLLPVTGLPLPLISYGGTFQLTIYATLGLLLNISAHRYDY
ncbi:MAG: rod shape-determining protein RodA [Candidatus Eisenbacteria bacterium]